VCVRARVRACMYACAFVWRFTNLNKLT